MPISDPSPRLTEFVANTSRGLLDALDNLEFYEIAAKILSPKAEDLPAKNNQGKRRQRNAEKGSTYRKLADPTQVRGKRKFSYLVE